MTLGPDPVGVRVEIPNSLLGGGGYLHRLLPCRLDPVLGVSARLRRDLLRGVMRSLEDPGDLLSEPLERAPDRRVGRSGRLQLRDQLARVPHILVDREPIVSA
jgi:hypothetical protein